jgi:hypothetical protein
VPIIRKFAVQGHAVPSGPYGAYGPFPRELYSQPRGEDDFEYGDSLHEALDDVRMFRCKDCSDVLYEDELDAHECEEE